MALPGSDKTTRHPSYLKMVEEAVGERDVIKGLTIQGIKQYIQVKYPSAAESVAFNHFVRTAVLRGLDRNLICRQARIGQQPQVTGVQGRFKLVKTATNSRKANLIRSISKNRKEKLPQKSKLNAANEHNSKVPQNKEMNVKKDVNSKKSSKEARTTISKYRKEKLPQKSKLNAANEHNSKVPQNKEMNVKKDVNSKKSSKEARTTEVKSKISSQKSITSARIKSKVKQLS